MNIKTVKIIPEPLNSKHKYKAVFTFKDNSTSSTKFGAQGYSDFTTHKDPERKKLYIARHKKDLSTNDPTKAGYLSMFILWNKPTLTASIKDYKSRIDIYNKTNKFPKN